MTGIHDVFPPDPMASKDPIAETKLIQGDGIWAIQKQLLGFNFDGQEKTMCLSKTKHDVLLNTLHAWIYNRHPVPFADFS